MLSEARLQEFDRESQKSTLSMSWLGQSHSWTKLGMGAFYALCHYPRYPLRVCTTLIFCYWFYLLNKFVNLSWLMKKLQKYTTNSRHTVLFAIETALETYLKSILEVPNTGTRVLDNTRPFLCSSTVSFWIPPALSKEERKYHIFRKYWYT